MDSFRVTIRKLDNIDKVVAEIIGVVKDGFCGPRSNFRYFIDKNNDRHELSLEGYIVSLSKEPKPVKLVKNEELVTEIVKESNI